jgi:hypothetical protein
MLHPPQPKEDVVEVGEHAKLYHKASVKGNYRQWRSNLKEAITTGQPLIGLVPDEPFAAIPQQTEDATVSGITFTTGSLLETAVESPKEAVVYSNTRTGNEPLLSFDEEKQEEETSVFKSGSLMATGLTRTKSKKSETTLSKHKSIKSIKPLLSFDDA